MWNHAFMFSVTLYHPVRPYKHNFSLALYQQRPPLTCATPQRFSSARCSFYLDFFTGRHFFGGGGLIIYSFLPPTIETHIALSFQTFSLVRSYSVHILIDFAKSTKIFEL